MSELILLAATMAFIRDGALAQAEPLLTEVLNGAGYPRDISALALVFHAMAEAHLGHLEKARAHLGELEKLVLSLPVLSKNSNLPFFKELQSAQEIVPAITTVRDSFGQ